MNMSALALFMLLLFCSSAWGQVQDAACLDQCSANRRTCQQTCASLGVTYVSVCAVYCPQLQKNCQATCPIKTSKSQSYGAANTRAGQWLDMASLPAAVTTSSRPETGRVICGSLYYHSPHIFTCPLPYATSNMTLHIYVIRQLSTIKCVQGVNYGLAPDNSYLWVSSGCAGEFSLTSSTTSSSQPAPTVTTTTTTTATSSVATTSSIRNVEFCGTAGESGFRIIGGTDASKCQFPWMVMIYNQRLSNICGGSILDASHILTAAHCFWYTHEQTGAAVKVKPNELLVFSGSSTMPFLTSNIVGLKRRVVSQVTTHENYDTRTLANDIAILTLSSPITFDTCHRPICLINGSKRPQETQNCRTMGWGLASNDANAPVQSQLQWLDLPVVSDTACTGVYGSLAMNTSFCAGTPGRDSCQGDSGGPFVCKESEGKYYLYGLVSAGLNHTCGVGLGLYTRVSSFLTWIHHKTV